MSKIKVKMFKVDGCYHCKIDSIKYCCGGFKKQYDNALNIKYIYKDNFPTPKVGIISNIGIHQDYDYVMDWELEDEILQLGDPELEYDLSIINYCPYCGKKINLEIDVQNELPKQAAKLITFLNSKKKERSRMKMTNKNGRPLTLDDAQFYLNEIIGEIPDGDFNDCFVDEDEDFY